VLDHRAQLELGAVCDDGATRAFVNIGDAWPLCTVETWRQRAERLERKLEALCAALIPGMNLARSGSPP
jgi:hypothetical protein